MRHLSICAGVRRRVERDRSGFIFPNTPSVLSNKRQFRVSNFWEISLYHSSRAAVALTPFQVEFVFFDEKRFDGRAVWFYLEEIIAERLRSLNYWW